MTNCPNCEYDGMLQSHPANVGEEDYAKVQAALWPDVYDGMDACGFIEDGGTYGVRVTIDQSAYATENHFKHRDQYEAMPHITVEDVESGTVDVWFDSIQGTITGWRCPECKYAWHEEIGELPDNYF